MRIKGPHSYNPWLICEVPLMPYQNGSLISSTHIVGMDLTLQGPIKELLYIGTESSGHENLRALESHPKSILWEIEVQFCN